MRNAILTLLLFGLLAASANPAAFYEGLTAARLRGSAVTDAWADAGLNTGLVSYWAMRTNSSTTVFDEWGSNDGTAVNGVLFGGAYGKRDDGAGFDGENDYINCGTGSSLSLPVQNGLCVAAWIKLRDAKKEAGTANRDYIACRIGSGHVQNMQYAFTTQPRGAIGTSLRLFFRNSANTAFVAYDTDTSGYYLTESNTWYHVVLSVDSVANGGLLGIYVDGELVHSATNTASSTTTATTMYIGWEGSNPRYFDGSVDEVPIWNRALSSNEVYQIYNTPLNAPYKE